MAPRLLSGSADGAVGVFVIAYSVDCDSMVFVVIDENQQALIFNRQGQGRLVVGPQRVSCVAR